jgi:putative membrane protein
MKRYGFLSIALAAAVTLGCNSSARHDESAPNPSAGAVGTAGSEESKVSSGDKDFVKDIATASTAEVELGRIAADRASNPEVKQFAQKMVDDHTKANDELASLASQHSIQVANEMDDSTAISHKLRAAGGIRSCTSTRWWTHNDVLASLIAVDKETLDKWKTQSRRGGQKGED